ncbi:MAG TPA: MYG1 family protein, partial [Candidatus Paceibacterota bacterium]|nr:MYG1 family protein [Candidatus Paceibacterota bacterium]
PTWLEDLALTDEFFKNNIGMAKQILKREIRHVQDKVKAEVLILEAYKNSKDKRLLTFDINCPLGDILKSLPEVLFAVYPRRHDGLWTVTAISDQGTKTFINRKDLPSAWGGLRDEELQKVTGVNDAVFCHQGLYMAVAKSKEGAIKLAQIAVES